MSFYKFIIGKDMAPQNKNSSHMLIFNRWNSEVVLWNYNIHKKSVYIKYFFL